jgi:hypothetical protein
MMIDERFVVSFGFIIYVGMFLMIEHGVMSVRLERVFL